MMLDRAPQNNDIRRSIDACLPGLENHPAFESNVFKRVRGEVILKKKLSVGFVLVIALVLIAVTALAAVLLWQQQVVPMKEIERTEGDYVHWPLSQKQVLIRALMDLGNILESGHTARLFDHSTDDAEKQAIADQLVLTLTGQTDTREITVDIITYAIMGPTDTWTPEQRVWWQQVTDQFYGKQGASDTLVTPNADVITQAEAIAIAKAAIMAAYGLPSDTLDKTLPVANLYVTEQRPDYRRWDVQFKVLREGSDSYVERVYAAIVDENGEVIADPDVGMPSVAEAAANRKHRESTGPLSPMDLYMKYMEQAGNVIFQRWPLKMKAEYSQVVAPQVRAAVDSGDLSLLSSEGKPDLAVIACSSYTYGVPQAQDITEENAYALAKQAVMDTYRLDSQTIALYDDSYFYFDITHPDAPLWKIVFWPSYASAEKFPDGFASGQGHLRYKVALHARTGEVLTAEEFECEPLGGDLEYQLKLY